MIVGTYLLCRVEEPLTEVAALANYDVYLEQQWRSPDGWALGYFTSMVVEDDIDTVLAELSEDGAFPLSGFQCDDDAIVVEARSPQAGHWLAELGPARHASMRAEVGLPASDRVTPQDATRYATAWAAEAGLTINPDALATVWHLDARPIE